MNLLDRRDSIIRRKEYVDKYGKDLADRLIKVIGSGTETILNSNKSVAQKTRELERHFKIKRDKSDDLLIKEMRALHGVQAEWAQDMLSETALEGKRAVDDVIKAGLSRPLIANNGLTPQQVYDNAWKRTGDQLKNYVRADAIAEGNPELVVKTPASAIEAQFKRDITTSARTASFSVASETENDVFLANEDIIRGIMFSAVLDGKTTPYCMSVDGDIVPLKGSERAPFHMNCRTLNIPVMNSETDEEARAALQMRAQIKPGENYESGDNKLDSTRKNAADGKIKIVGAQKKSSSSANYGSFLGSQTNSVAGRTFIKDKLGDDKGGQFIKGIRAGKDPNELLKELLIAPKRIKVPPTPFEPPPKVKKPPPRPPTTQIKKKVTTAELKKVGDLDKPSVAEEALLFENIAYAQPKAKGFVDRVPLSMKAPIHKKVLETDSGYVIRKSGNGGAYYRNSDRRINMNPDSLREDDGHTFLHELGHRTDHVLGQRKGAPEMLSGTSKFLNGQRLDRSRINDFMDDRSAPIHITRARQKYENIIKNKKATGVNMNDFLVAEGKKMEGIYGNFFRLGDEYLAKRNPATGWREQMYAICKAAEELQDPSVLIKDGLGKAQTWISTSKEDNYFFMLAFADTIGENTNGEYGYGHDLDYYHNRYGRKVVETFAHVFAFDKKKDFSELVRFFLPNVYKAIKEALDEY